MCIANRLNREQLRKLKAKLPNEFDVWRVMEERNGEIRGLYSSSNKDETSLPGLHKAKFLSVHKMFIDYAPGFHVFGTREGAGAFAEDFLNCSTVIVMARAKKEWVTAAGNAEIWEAHSSLLDYRVFVLSHVLMPG